MAPGPQRINIDAHEVMEIWDNDTLVLIFLKKGIDKVKTEKGRILVEKSEISGETLAYRRFRKS